MVSKGPIITLLSIRETLRGHSALSFKDGWYSNDCISIC